MDQRERFNDPEEALRVALAGIMKHHWSALVSIVSQDSDGRTVQAQPAIKRRDIDQNGNETFVDHPLLVDQPVHFPGGGGVTLTHPVHAGDEILSVIASRPPETWMQSGGTQNPAYTRTHSLSDAIAIASLRSTPRALQQISTATAQIRDDAKHHTLDHDPASGTHIKSVDPSTAPASSTFDPFTSATTFYEHLVKGASGIVGNATNDGTTHSHGVNHDAGAFMSALNGLHQVMAHPTQGAVLSALNGEHTVTATPSGVQISSTSGINLSAPSVGLPNGSVSFASLGNGAGSASLGGDLSGELPNPEVVGITHVAGANLLPSAASDSAAAAAGVVIGGLYRNTTISSGTSVLCVRMT